LCCKEQTPLENTHSHEEDQEPDALQPSSASPEAAAPLHTFTTEQFCHAVIATNLLAEKSNEQVSARRGCEKAEIPTTLFVRAGKGGSGKKMGERACKAGEGELLEKRETKRKADEARKGILSLPRKSSRTKNA
jgi:hypothetical protein